VVGRIHPTAPAARGMVMVVMGVIVMVENGTHLDFL